MHESNVRHLPPRRPVSSEPIASKPLPPATPAAEGLLNDRDLEREYGLARKTWQTMRHTRRGPPYFKLGDRCLYRREDVETWLASRRIEPLP